jgi:hypothetical protein
MGRVPLKNGEGSPEKWGGFLKNEGEVPVATGRSPPKMREVL